VGLGRGALSPSGLWSAAQAEIEFGAFNLKMVTNINIALFSEGHLNLHQMQNSIIMYTYRYILHLKSPDACYGTSVL